MLKIDHCFKMEGSLKFCSRIKQNASPRVLELKIFQGRMFPDPPTREGPLALLINLPTGYKYFWNPWFLLVTLHKQSLIFKPDHIQTGANWIDWDHTTLTWYGNFVIAICYPLATSPLTTSLPNWQIVTFRIIRLP